jgi:hypothetical protein
MAVCLWTASGYFSRAIWTPLPWFLLACAVYFGLGPLIYVFGNDASIELVDYVYPVDVHALLRMNMLNAVGIAIISGTVWLAQHIWPTSARLLPPTETSELHILFWQFLLIGLTVEVFLTMPYKMGLLSWTLPGAIQHLSNLSKVSIILGFVLIARGAKEYLWIVYPLIGLEMVLGLMTFYKQAVLEVLIAGGLGWSLSRPKLRTVLIAGTCAVFLYAIVLTPFVSFARIAYKTMGVPAVEDILQAIESYWEVSEDFDGYNPGAQYWWARLAYVNAQAFAMDAYDHSGPKGETLSLAPYAILPRVLIPSKPLISPGRDFAAMVLGEYDEFNAMSPGIFAEGYWNSGWLAVAVVCIYVGLLFVGFSRFSERMIGQDRYEYVPIVTMGIVMGYSINDWFPMVFVGGLVEAVSLYVVIRFLLMPSIRTMAVFRPTLLLRPKKARSH